MCSVIAVLHLETLSKTVVSNQDLVQTAHVDNKGTPLPNSIKSEVCDQNHQEEQVKNSTYTSPQQHQKQRHQFQQQYVSIQAQNIYHPPQPIYGYEYDGAKQEQVYYTQQQHANAPPQYQSMTTADAAATICHVSKQFTMGNIEQPNSNPKQA